MHIAYTVYKHAIIFIFFPKFDICLKSQTLNYGWNYAKHNVSNSKNHALLFDRRFPICALPPLASDGCL